MINFCVRIYILLLCFLYGQQLCLGSQSDSILLKSDQYWSSTQVDTATLQILRSDATYDYIVTNTQDNYIQRLWKNFKNWWNDLFSASDKNILNRTLSALVLLFGLGLLIYHILRSQGIGFRQKDIRAIPSHLQAIISTDNITEIHKMIEAAEVDLDFKKGIQLQYLLALLELENQDRIQLKEHKTNNDFVAEILDQEISVSFQKVCAIFEKVHYGDFPADVVLYDSMKEKVIALRRHKPT